MPKSFPAPLALMLLLLIPVLPTSESLGQGIRGLIRDAEGGPLSGVQVVVQELGRGVVSDIDGRYMLEGLPAGPVRVEFRYVGFSTQIHDLVLLFGKTEVLDVTMESEAVLIGEVVVTAEGQASALLKRSTRSVTSLDSKDLEDLRGQSLGDMLDNLPGVTTLTTGPSIAKPVVRGLHSQRIVIMNAGVVQEGQQWGGEHAPEIDPFAPSRIEVIKGAAGVEYGVGAIGGVVRLEPAELPDAQRISGSIMANGFSNNLQGAGSVRVQGGPLRFPGVGWRVQTSYRRAGDTRTPDYVVGNSGFRENDVTVEFGYESENVGWHAHLSHFGTTLGLFSGAHIGNFDDLIRAIERGRPVVDYDFTFDIEAPKQQIAHDLATLKGHVTLPSGDWLEAQYGFQSNRRKEFDAHARFGDVSTEPAFALTLETHTLDLKLRQKPRGRWLGAIGVSGMNQANVNGETGMLIPNFHALTGGLFVHETWVSGPLTLEGGLRFDYRWLEAYPRENVTRGDFVRRTHDWSSPTGVLGAIWKFSEHWSLSTNLATAWRPPGVNELYNFGVHHGTAQFEIGDASLGAEQSRAVDVTLRHVSDALSLEVSSYVNRMNGYIHLRPEPQPRVTIRGSFPSFRYAQTDARLAGLDGSLSLTSSRGTSGSAVLSIVRGTDLVLDGPLYLMPADRVLLSVAQTFRETMRAEVSATLVARQDRFEPGIDYADPPDGYGLMGARVSGTVALGGTPLSFSLSGENLLNRSYRDYLSRFRYFIDNPGRTFAVRLSIPFGPPQDN